MKKPRYRLFTILICVFVILGILTTTVGKHFEVVLTVAMEGSAVDEELAEQSYQAGLAMNVELVEEGCVLLQNQNHLLPLEKGKVNVFGNKAVAPVYNGSGSSAGTSKGAVTLKDGLEHAGFAVNEELWKLIEENSSDADTGVHEGNEADLSNYPINEMSADQYTGSCSFDKLKEYSDIAIVCIGRSGGEGQDLPRSGYGDDGSSHYLALSSEERELLQTLKKEGFRTTVLINTSYAMELGFLEEKEYGVQAALWIGGPGIAGFSAVGEILAGGVTPSGRLADTYAYDLTTQSTFITSDYYYYLDAADENSQLGGFTNYSEGIYMGYRWYETADAEGYWKNVKNSFGNKYEGVVQYPFGYGLSYTSFEQSIVSATAAEDTITFEVNVKNTGNEYEGKDVIQIYCEAPYIQGGIEKSKVVLAAFAKTKLLAPGEDENYSLTLNLEDLASYSCDADSGNGAYVLDKGNYYFYLSDHAHSWSDIDTSDTAKCYTYGLNDDIIYSGDNKRQSDVNTAVNQFAAADHDIPKLSRADSFANAEETIAAPIEDVTVAQGDELYDMLKTNAAQAGEFQGETGNTETGTRKKYTMSDMAGADYQDERWEEFLSQMTVDEMKTLIGTGGWSTAEVSSIGKSKTTDIDGPFGLSNFIKNEMGNSENACVSYCSEVMIASTWNLELVERFGQTVGDEANATGVSGWYAPGANLHRSSFGGRNPEYYSEDSLLSGKMCAVTAKGALAKGLYVYVKHFAFNDQEANRTNKENCWMTEQTAREIYLKPFETAVKEGGATGLMASYMWFEGVWCGGNYNLLTNVVRNEWGFQGVITTDNYCAGWMNATKAVMAGADMILSNTLREISEETANTDEGITAMKAACKNILYTIANAAQNRTVEAKSGFNYWKLTYISCQVIFYGTAAILFLLIMRKHRKYKRYQKGNSL